MTEEKRGGFQRPQPAQDNWASGLREKHGLPLDASLEEVEAKATQLLGSPLTSIAGAELILGRRVDARDQEVTLIIMAPGLSAEDKFGLLLIQKGIEDMQKKQGAK